MASEYARKIKALLAKANGTDNPHERDLYQERAERLMVKWGVSDAMLAQVRDEAIITEFLQVDDKPLDGWCVMLNNIALGMGTVKVYTTSPLTEELDFVILYLVGHKSDIERLKIMWEGLRPQATQALQEYWDRYVFHLPPTEAILDWVATAKRAQFLAAFGSSVGERIRRDLSTEMAFHHGAELVLASRRQAVDDWVTESVEPPRQTFYFYEDLSARIAGLTGGGQATLGDTDGR
jgi:hypothetical protein